MWVFTQSGFYSVVAYVPPDEGRHDQQEDFLLVRARVREDLERLRQWIPDVRIQEHEGADYRFRAVVAREEWKRILAGEVDSVNYTNFKNRVAERQGHERHDAYKQVWSALRRLQSSSRDDT